LKNLPRITRILRIKKGQKTGGGCFLPWKIWIYRLARGDGSLRLRIGARLFGYGRHLHIHHPGKKITALLGGYGFSEPI